MEEIQLSADMKIKNYKIKTSFRLKTGIDFFTVFNLIFVEN